MNELVVKYRSEILNLLSVVMRQTGRHEGTYSVSLQERQYTVAPSPREGQGHLLARIDRPN